MLYIPSVSFIYHQRILFIIHFFFKFQQNIHRLKLQFCQFQFFLHGFLVQIFLSFQLQCKEVVLDANDIAKAIIDYVVHESIDKLVLGASSRNAFSRSCFFFFFLIPTPNLSLSLNLICFITQSFQACGCTYICFKDCTRILLCVHNIEGKAIFG